MEINLLPGKFYRVFFNSFIPSPFGNFAMKYDYYGFIYSNTTPKQLFPKIWLYQPWEEFTLEFVSIIIEDIYKVDYFNNYSDILNNCSSDHVVNWFKKNTPSKLLTDENTFLRNWAKENI